MKESSAISTMVPANHTGKSVDLEYEITENSREEAIDTFKRAVKRLLNPHIWHELAGSVSAKFELRGLHEPAGSRLAQLNDYIRIDIPGPGSSAGDGYDWVQVVDISENADLSADQSFGMTTQASINPNRPEEGIAHFFGKLASSTFIVKRYGNTVIVTYHGRNEKPNTKKVNLQDKVRNTMVATGAAAGISELQWNALIKGLLQKEIGG